MLSFYNIFIGLYLLGIKLISFKSAKAKLWLAGRVNWSSKLKAFSAQNNKPTIWVHCASLGEFEQGRPIIEEIKNNYPGYTIVLTFFSPSGYEIRKNYSQADAIFYLPIDNKKNAKLFIELLNPSFVIWVKYEYWYHYLTTLNQKNIPVFLISAKFRNSQPFFKWYGSLHKRILKCFTHIFIQKDFTSEKLLQKININNFSVAGDTRFDRVVAISNSNATLPESLDNFSKNNKVIVAGSTWQEDEELLVHYANVHPQIKFIIAPHDVDELRINELQKVFKKSVLISELNNDNGNIQILIIDNIGLLSQLYKLANITYIGGGFNSSGIHNILEAAVYGKPIIFGPIYQKFSEAVDLVDMQGAFSVNNALELEALLDKLFEDNSLMQNACASSLVYVKEMQGATQKIIQYFYENLLLTKL